MDVFIFDVINFENIDLCWGYVCFVVGGYCGVGIDEVFGIKFGGNGIGLG